jgi:soluble cytochrome b562
MPPKPEPLDELAPWAMDSVLDLRLDESLASAINQLTDDQAAIASPWLLCYQAMERRLARGDHSATLRLAQAAAEAFKCLGDADGQARAAAEAAIARYHLGQYALALSELAACPHSEQPSCIAAVALATYINQIGINALPAAIQAADRGLRAIEHEASAFRRAIWRIVLQRNLTAAYQYQGELAAARAAAEDAVRLAETYHTNGYLYA